MFSNTLKLVLFRALEMAQSFFLLSYVVIYETDTFNFEFIYTSIIAALLIIFSEFHLDAPVLKIANKRGSLSSKIVTSAFSLRIMTSGVSILILFSTSFFMGIWNTLVICYFSILLVRPVFFPDFLFHFLDSYSRMINFLIMEKLCLITFFLVSFYFKSFSTDCFFYFAICSFIIICMVSFFYFKASLTTFCPRTMKRLFKYCSKLLIVNLIHQYNRVGKLLVFNNELIGPLKKLELSERFANLIRILINSFNKSLLGKSSRGHIDPKFLLRYVFIGIACCLLISFIVVNTNSLSNFYKIEDLEILISAIIAITSLSFFNVIAKQQLVFFKMGASHYLNIAIISSCIFFISLYVLTQIINLFSVPISFVISLGLGQFAESIYILVLLKRLKII